MEMKKMKEFLFWEASGRGLLIKIYDFLRDPVLRALSGGGLGGDSFIKNCDFLKQFCAQDSPEKITVWDCLARGAFIIKDIDFNE